MCAFWCGCRGLRRSASCSAVKYANVWLRVLMPATETVRHFHGEGHEVTERTSMSEDALCGFVHKLSFVMGHEFRHPMRLVVAAD